MLEPKDGDKAICKHCRRVIHYLNYHHSWAHPAIHNYWFTCEPEENDSQAAEPILWADPLLREVLFEWGSYYAKA